MDPKRDHNFDNHPSSGRLSEPAIPFMIRLERPWSSKRRIGLKGSEIPASGFKVYGEGGWISGLEPRPWLEVSGVVSYKMLHVGF